MTFLTRHQMPSEKARKAAAKAKKNKNTDGPKSKLDATALVRVLNVPRGMTPLFLYRELLGGEGFGSTILDIEKSRRFASGGLTTSTYIFMSSVSAAQFVAKKLKALSGRIEGASDIRNARISLMAEVLNDISEAADKNVTESLSEDLKAEAELNDPQAEAEWDEDDEGMGISARVVGWRNGVAIMEDEDRDMGSRVLYSEALFDLAQSMDDEL